MIHVECEQGSQEWLDARIGIPTASCFHRILTPKTLKPSSQADKYMDELLAEWLTGAALDSEVSDFMARGKELEPKAVKWYEFQKDVDTTEVGFCKTDDGRCGASPDRLVLDDGGLEIKCFGAVKHVECMRAGMPAEKRLQVQGGIWICERDWWDFLAYNPEMPPVLVPTPRDDDLIKKIRDAVLSFCDRLDEAKESLLNRGYTPSSPVGAGAQQEGV